MIILIKDSMLGILKLSFLKKSTLVPHFLFIQLA